MAALDDSNYQEEIKKLRRLNYQAEPPLIDNFSSFANNLARVPFVPTLFRSTFK
jgi:hypothetical protein